MVQINTEHGHLVEQVTYDENLRAIWRTWSPKPGYQLNGHRVDCRCSTCRPDLHLVCPDALKCFQAGHGVTT